MSAKQDEHSEFTLHYVNTHTYIHICVFIHTNMCTMSRTYVELSSWLSGSEFLSVFIVRSHKPNKRGESPLGMNVSGVSGSENWHRFITSCCVCILCINRTTFSEFVKSCVLFCVTVDMYQQHFQSSAQLDRIA